MRRNKLKLLFSFRKRDSRSIGRNEIVKIHKFLQSHSTPRSNPRDVSQRPANNLCTLRAFIGLICEFDFMLWVHIVGSGHSWDDRNTSLPLPASHFRISHEHPLCNRLLLERTASQTRYERWNNGGELKLEQFENGQFFSTLIYHVFCVDPNYL